MSDLKELIGALSNLTVAEAAKLVKDLENEWGVSAAAPVAVAGAVAGGAQESAGEKNSFNVILKSVDAAKKIAVIKVVKEIAGVGLGEAKAIVDGAPKEVKNNANKAEAEEIKKKLEEAGAVVELQ